MYSNVAAKKTFFEISYPSFRGVLQFKYELEVL